MVIDWENPKRSVEVVLLMLKLSLFLALFESKNTENKLKYKSECKPRKIEWKIKQRNPNDSITSSDIHLCHPIFYFLIISALLFNQGTTLLSHSLIRFK